MYDSGHIISCCKGCADRYIGCHSECDRYKQQTEEWKKAKEEYKKIKQLLYAKVILIIMLVREPKDLLQKEFEISIELHIEL